MMILKYEIQKMFSNRTSKVANLFLIILLCGLCIGYVKGVYWVQEDGTKIYGMEAIRNQREAKSPWNGPVTEEVVAEVIQQNTQIEQNPEYHNRYELNEKGFAKKQGFYDLRELINDFYREDFNFYDYYMINGLSPQDAKGFYERRPRLFSQWLESDEVGQAISPQKKAYIMAQTEAMETPLLYNYADGWIKIKEMNVTLLFGIVIVVCIILANNFSIECQTRSDAIYLTTQYGKTRGNRMKILAGFLVATVMYWGAILIADGILLAIFGTDGASSPIQIEWWKCIHNISQEQAWILLLLIGYVGCLVMSSITMLLSARFKTAFAGIIISFLLIMIPAILGQTFTNVHVTTVLSLCPHACIMGYNILKTWGLYEIGGRIWTDMQILPIIHGILTLVLIPFTYGSFQKYKG